MPEYSNSEMRNAISEFVHHQRYRELLHLRFCDGLTYEEIADRTNFSPQHVKHIMCQDKIDSKNEKIVELQNKLNMADFAASQASQDNYLQNALTAQTQYFLSLYPPTAAAARTSTTTG